MYESFTFKIIYASDIKQKKVQSALCDNMVPNMKGRVKWAFEDYQNKVTLLQYI